MRPRLFALAWAAALSACLPNPQSVKEKRESFDREPLQGELLLSAPPENMKPVGAVFGDRVKLVGYTLEVDGKQVDANQVRRGDRADIKLYWSVLKPVSEDYEVFVHGDAISGNARRIHGDHFPAKGKYPTDVWREGEIVVDPFSVDVPADYGPSRLGIYTGMYLGDYRVPLTDKGAGEADNENRSRPIEIVLE